MLEVRDEPNLAQWMSRKTMKSMASQFSGAKEFLVVGAQLDSSNHEYMYQETTCAA